VKNAMNDENRTVQDLKVKVAQATRILFEWGLADFYGHASARVPGTNFILIKPSIRSLATIEPGDILTVDMNNYQQGDMTDPLMREKGLPPGEVILHIAMYRKRPDVMGVVHTHQLLATTMGIAGKPIVPLHNQTASFSPGTPIFDKPDMVSNETIAAEVAEAIGDHNGILLRGHGVVVVGRSIEEATVNAIYLERAAKIQILANLVGTPIPIDDAYCKQFSGQIDSVRVRDAFDFFVSLLGSPIKGLM
jgi:ribulose-5-phosphate 4-epimerase/fuculose-1-phosphate aldolase